MKKISATLTRPTALACSCSSLARPLCLIGALLLFGVQFGCGMMSSARTVLYDGPRATVLLENVPERGTTAGFRSPVGLNAAHPVILEAPLLVAVLRGIQIKHVSGRSELSGPSGIAGPVFTEEEALFLAPLLGTALTKASASQYVIFHLLQPPVGFEAGRATGAAPGPSVPPAGASQQEQTSGALYVYGHSLYLTITEFRAVPKSPGTIQPEGRQSPDPTGLAGYIITFSPASALRPDSYRQSALPLPNELPSLVIDYELLPRTAEPPSPVRSLEPPPVAATAPMAGQPLPAHVEELPSAREMQELKDLIIKKDLELERLREEVQRLKQEKKRTQPPLPGGESNKKSSSKTPAAP